MKTVTFTFHSHTGQCEIYACKYLPDSQPRAVMVFNHGMAEHQGRYTNFLEYMTGKGYAVYFHDMANHGKSNRNYDETGYFGDSDGYKNLVLDLKEVFSTAHSDYPDLPTVVMGHSMGSFIVRCYGAWYPDNLSALIVCGTGGPNPLAGAGDKMSHMIAKIKGSKYKSKMLDKITFGSYNDHFEKRTNYDWLTKDNAIVDRYIDDPYCGFLFTVAGMNDLVKINAASNSKECFEKTPDIPIFLISGAEDPVGEYGKGVTAVYDRLKQTGHTKTVMKLYPGDRHEILNELDKDKVMDDINSFIQDNVLNKD